MPKKKATQEDKRKQTAAFWKFILQQRKNKKDESTT
jgi:hypothetical protein|tara:strand:+ start:333 stop:440 length:108 start_codon:yes stop_codon:yes gene_type:complete